LTGDLEAEVSALGFDGLEKHLLKA